LCEEKGSGHSENACRKWAEGDQLTEAYHDYEWCRVNHDDQFEFEMLCLEGASVGLSWRTILHKRDSYKKAFHNFDIQKCAEMNDEELTALLDDSGLIRNRSKIFSVRSNAKAVQKIQKEFGSFDAYLWSFTDGKQIDRKWERPEEVPAESELSERISRDLKKRGMKYVGPVITYSFLQSIGIINDHLISCEYR
jgi:DNA-3-methyladenine glycosylase I